MTLLGAAATVVYQPAVGPAPGYNNGLWVEPYRAPSSELLAIEPITSATGATGENYRMINSEGESIAGEIAIFATSDVLQTPSDENGQAGTWVEFNSKIYQVRSRNVWYDEVIPSVEYYGFLLRPQPLNVEPEEEEDP